MTAAAPAPIGTYIDDEWSSDGTATLITQPLDGSSAFEVVETSAAEVDRAVAAAVREAPAWARTPAFARAAAIDAAADVMDRNADALAAAITRGSGKTIRESQSEVDRGITTFRTAAAEAGRLTGEISPSDLEPAGKDRMGFAIRVPVGVVAAITPFNAPFNLLAHKIGPALAAGNTSVVKAHPRGAEVTRLAIDAFREAGLPAGVLSVINGEIAPARQLVAHPGIDFVTFTGSTEAGKDIVSRIGLKRSILELGGNAPTIVHSDADLSLAVQACVGGAFGLTGQSCVSTQRILVHESILGAFLEPFVAAVGRLAVGDPWQPTTDVGPMVDEAAAERLTARISDAVDGGATLHTGGTRTGSLLAPTVLSGVRLDDDVYCREAFGPVVNVVPYSSVDDAIRFANATPFGLRAGVFTDSLGTMLRFARELSFGSININAASRFRVDHEPSGGVKDSGWGREGPRHAMAAMTDLHWISIPS